MVIRPALAVTVALLTGLVSACGSSDSDTDVARPAAAQPPRNFEAWVDPADRIVNLTLFVPAVRETFGERFGFIEIDRTDPAVPVVRVGVRNVSSADEAALAAIAESPQIVLENAKASEAQINAWKAAAGALMVGLDRNMMLGGDARTGTLHLVADELTEAEAEAFRASVPPGVMQIEVRPGFEGVVLN